MINTINLSHSRFTVNNDMLLDNFYYNTTKDT